MKNKKLRLPDIYYSVLLSKSELQFWTFKKDAQMDLVVALLTFVSRINAIEITQILRYLVRERERKGEGEKKEEAADRLSSSPALLI